MKKLISMFVAFILVASMSTGVFAAINPTDFYSVDNKYTVEVNVGSDGAGKMFGMVAITGDQITEDSIVYIDQATADADGKLVFSSFGPMGKLPSEAGYVESTVYIGGECFTSAQLVGTLKAVPSDAGSDSDATVDSDATSDGDVDSDATTDSGSTPAGVPGDMDGNEVCNDDDAIYLLMHALLGQDMYPLADGINADIDNNGTVNDDDAIYLLMYALLGEDMYPLYPAN